MVCGSTLHRLQRILRLLEQGAGRRRLDGHRAAEHGHLHAGPGIPAVARRDVLASPLRGRVESCRVETVHLLLTSDTHVPKRARELPAPLLDRIECADVVFHAGDWVDVPTLELLEGRASRLVAVYGNNDGPELRSRLPEVARIELDGVRFGVVHETGSAQGRERRCAERFPDLDVLVFGHSHIPWDTTAPGGLRLLNPGSPTDRRRQPNCTYMTAEVVDGRLTEVHLHCL